MNLGKIFNLRAGILLLLTVGMCSAAEIRTWTSIKGTTLEGKLLRVDGERVIIQSKEGRQVEVKKGDLSQEDLNYLKDFGGDGGKPPVGSGTAPKKAAEVTMPSKELKVDRKAYKHLPNALQIPGLSYKILETPHFWVGYTNRLKPEDTGEHAERMWHEMNMQHPTFKNHWNDGQRFLILMVESEEDWSLIGDWYAANLKKAGNGDKAAELSATWPKADLGSIGLDAATVEKHRLIPFMRCIRIRDKKQWDMVWSSPRTHTIFTDLMSIHLGGVADYGKKGLFAFISGLGYYKEIQLTGTTETSLVTYSDDTRAEVDKAGGFDDGAKWPELLKKLVKKGKLKPKLNILWELTANAMSPEQCVLMYSFSRYLQSTPDRLEKYATLAERIQTGHQIPPPVEVAKIYGFETAEELEKDWAAYLESKEFK